MIGNYPITWLVTELMSLVLFTMCIFHALKQENARGKIFEFLLFMVGAAVFEHVGVLLTKTYTYDQHRIFMAGLIPLSVLILEAAIVYAAMILFEYLNMPKWTSIWVVGFFSVFMDFSIDPVYINDKYLIDGTMSGQWNWVYKYDGTFFGIPFQNFTGWIYMTGFYAALVYLGYWASKKYHKKWLHTATPFLSGILLIVPIMLFGALLIDGNGQRTPELIKLILGCGFAVILMAIYWKRMKPIDFKKDWIIVAVPGLIYLYNIIVGFGRGITLSYIPIIGCFIIHASYLYVLYRKSHNLQVNSK